jgi:hypothetical protein
VEHLEIADVTDIIASHHNSLESCNTPNFGLLEKNSNNTFLTLFEFAIAFSVPHLILKPWQSLRIFGFSHLHTWGYDQR